MKQTTISPEEIKLIKNLNKKGLAKSMLNSIP